MRPRRFFTDVIPTLKVEEVRSEFQRSYLLIFLFTLILVIAVVNFLIINENIVTFYGGATAFIIVLGFIVD